MITEEYAPSRSLDVYGEGGKGVVLLWHGRAANSRGAVAGLAAVIAAHGRRVLVPDWDSDRPDGGRSALVASVLHARRLSEQTGRDPDDLVVAGWSLGGTAAVGLATGEDERLRVGRVVLLAPGDGPRAVDPFSGKPLPSAFREGPGRTRIDVVCGRHDAVATPELVRGLEARLRSAGWATSFTEVDADHGSIVLARRDDAVGEFVPAVDTVLSAAARTVAAIVAGERPPEDRVRLSEG
jgi:dienelactone hydrolase